MFSANKTFCCHNTQQGFDFTFIHPKYSCNCDNKNWLLLNRQGKRKMYSIFYSIRRFIWIRKKSLNLDSKGNFPSYIKWVNRHIRERDSRLRKKNPHFYSFAHVYFGNIFIKTKLTWWEVEYTHNLFEISWALVSL